MSRIVETKVRVGIEAHGGDQAQVSIGKITKDAKDLQQTFIGLDQGQSDLYKNISTMAPEVQNQVNLLEGSFTNLKREFGTLPNALKGVLGEILTNFQAGNLQAVSALTASSVYSKAPEAVQQNVAQMFQSTYELEKAGVGAEFGKLAPTGDSELNSGRWKRLSGSYESRLDTFERRLDGAETDLDTMTPSNVREMRRRFGEIGSVGRQARSAAGPGQEDALQGLDDRYAGYGTRLDDLIKQRSERGFNDGVETDEQTYSPNFERLFERRLGNIGAGVQGLSRSSPDGDLINMERRLARAGGDLAYNQPALKEDAFKNLSEGLKQQTDALGELLGSRRIENADRLGRPLEKRLAGLGGELDEVDPYTTSRRKLAGLRGRVNDARDDLAGLDGALEQKVFEDLTQSVEALTEKLDDNVQAYNESERGRSIPPSGSGGGSGGPPNILMDQIERMGGGGLLGGLLAKAIPGAALATGAVAAYNWADRAVSGANREARETAVAEADLARQYGLEGDPWTMFRSGSTGYSSDELLARGYTGDDAERIMAQLDRPSSRRGAVEDVKDIAAFSYSTGLDESRVTDAVRMMGLAGNYAPGNAETPLETLKMALTEGVKNGVSQADTMNALVDLSQQALAQGRRLSPEALAFQASLQKTLADTNNPVLKGAAGAEVQNDLNAFVTGQNDPAMQMLLAPALEGIDAADLKLTGDAAKGFTEMQKSDPLRARLDALNMLADGRNPELSAKLAGHLDDALGNNPTLMSHFLDQNGITGEAKFSVMGRGLESIYRDAAAGTPEFLQGEDVATDAQGDNELSRQSAAMAALERDGKTAGSRANLEDLGLFEKNVKNLSLLVRQNLNRIRMRNGRSGAERQAPGEIEVSPPRVISPELRDPFGTRESAPPELKPPMPTPDGPSAPTSDIGGEVGREAYFVMAGGLEGTVPDASNERTGAFGFSQVMPGNLIGDGKPDKNGLLQTGWDQSFLKTPEGKKWRNQLAQPGLNPNDPIPDQMAQIGVNDPNALPSWYNNLPQPAQKAMTGFVRDMTEYQLGRYYETARADGAGHDESVARTMAGWYGGYAWLDRDDPKRALSLDNPNFTRGHGKGGEEPSVQEYINKALKNGTFDLPELKQQSSQRVEVHVYGLDQIQVQGATQTAKATIRESINSIITAVSEPDAHHGMG